MKGQEIKNNEKAILAVGPRYPKINYFHKNRDIFSNKV